MSFPSLLWLSLSLAMDATAAAAAQGVGLARVRARHVLLVATFFGGAQAAMPALGWWLGGWLGAAVEAWDHWIAFGLLVLIGGKMLAEAREADAAPRPNAFNLGGLTIIAVATSLDAFAAGIGLRLLDAPFVLSLITIGLTTALLSAAGLFIGRRLGARVGRRLDVVGGLLLIALGTKILLEHTL